MPTMFRIRFFRSYRSSRVMLETLVQARGYGEAKRMAREAAQALGYGFFQVEG